MKRNLLTLGMILLPALALAATPDFAGSWARDAAKSDTVPNMMYWTTRTPQATRGGGPGSAAAGGQRGPQVAMTITQDATGLHQAEGQNALRTYMLDGRPHTRATDTGIQKAETTATVSGNDLIIETEQPFGGMPGNVSAKIKEVWTLSPDGRTLTIVTTRDIPARHEQYKQVYTRIANPPATAAR